VNSTQDIQWIAPDDLECRTLGREALAYQMARAASFMCGLFDKSVTGVVELRPFEYAILVSVTKGLDITAGRIAAEFCVSRPYMSICIERLVCRGLVERRTNPSDRRSHWLHPTPAGKEMALRATDLVLAEERNALVLSSTELGALSELLGKVAFPDRSRTSYTCNLHADAEALTDSEALGSRN
jgi:DNA-binding MarR family transcriptional regulator